MELNQMKIAVLLLIVAQVSGQAHHLKFHQSQQTCIVIEDDFLSKYRGLEAADENGMKYSIKPAQTIPESSTRNPSDEHIIEVFAKNHHTAEKFMKSLCRTMEKVKPFSSEDIGEYEIRKIVDGGEQVNRIDVVFMGDGYNTSERENFFSDIQRLTRDMFEAITFRSYLPLFNIWAIYLESEDSGIGYYAPINTPFKLYRSGEIGILRAIFPGNPYLGYAVCELTGPYGCEYPSIIGNDDFMGGLGGEFVIATKSETTGKLTLNHELGHNFGTLGEEYDHGYAYFGVNAADSVESLTWDHWLTEEKKEQRATLALMEYPWADLAPGPQTLMFTSDGTYSRWHILLTVSAAGEEDSVEFLLDGKVLPWKTRGSDDREIYTWFGDEGFSAGQHNFTVRSKTEPTHPVIPRMICHVKINEYGNEDEYKMSNDYISAYPQWSVYGEKWFRPTSEGCLMRNPGHDRLCPVCKEGIWVQFFERFTLIDNVTISESFLNGTREVTVETPNLGQKRIPGNEVPGEALEIKWFKGTQEQVNLRDQFTINAEPGDWTVEVHLSTPEIRHDPRNLATSTESFVITS